jgi:two-component system CitB family sensor kinase
METTAPDAVADEREIDFFQFPTTGGIEEGLLIVDSAGVVRYASETVAGLLRIEQPLVGRPLATLPVSGRLGELVRGAAEAHGTVLVQGRYLEITRLAIDGATRIGAVVLVRDRTELVDLFAELADVHAVVVGLRTRQHEHGNRLHVALGLVQTGEYDAAIGYLKDMIGMPPDAAVQPASGSVAVTNLAALLRTKASIAAARGVRLTIDWLADVDALGIDPDALASIVGNLIDNGIDAATDRPDASVSVSATSGPDGIRLVVRDSGPGVPEGVDVFLDGYTTKPPRAGMARGLGLALVRHLVARSAGSLTVHNDGGAVFTVRWPARPKRAG